MLLSWGRFVLISSSSSLKSLKLSLKSLDVCSRSFTCFEVTYVLVAVLIEDAIEAFGSGTRQNKESLNGFKVKKIALRNNYKSLVTFPSHFAI